MLKKSKKEHFASVTSEESWEKNVEVSWTLEKKEASVFTTGANKELTFFVKMKKTL